MQLPSGMNPLPVFVVDNALQIGLASKGGSWVGGALYLSFLWLVRECRQCMESDSTFSACLLCWQTLPCTGNVLAV